MATEKIKIGDYFTFKAFGHKCVGKRINHPTRLPYFSMTYYNPKDGYLVSPSYIKERDCTPINETDLLALKLSGTPIP